jgi:glyoxylase-like metal-dependent hydrolase (beta-lactamase superfamily II)
VAYFQRVLTAPATISPDAQSKAQKTPMFQGVTDSFEFGDAKQKVQVHATTGDAHTNEYTHAYLPGPRILVEGDAYSPGPADAPPPATPNPNSVKLYEDIEKLKLNVATIAPIHGRGPVPIAELRKFIGRR